MDLFEYAKELRFGDIHLKVDPTIDLYAIVAIHNVERGPAIGGCRFIEYDSTDDALRDAMRLARGMSYKAAISNLPHGGAKAVIMRPSGLDDDQRRQIFETYGEFVDELNGQYITCEDSGTNVADIDAVSRATPHVLGASEAQGGSGDPSPLTAFGVRRGIEAAAAHRYGRADLDGRHVAIQGVGHVGYYLAGELHERGATLSVTDLDEDAVRRCVDEFGARPVAADAIFDVDCDIFAPCALGAILDDDTIPRLRCDIVAGSANNQLAEDRHGSMLVDHDILYAPDYAINAGGLINVTHELTGYDPAAARIQIAAIYDTMATIFERASRQELSTALVADRIAQEELYGAPTVPAKAADTIA